MAERLLCGDLPQARRKLRDFAVPLRRIRRERRRLCRVLCLSALEARLFHGHLREKNAGLCRPLPTQETRRIHGLLYPGLRDTRRFTATSRRPAETPWHGSVPCPFSRKTHLFHGLRPCEKRGKKAAVFSETSLHLGRNTTRPRKTGAFVESSLRRGEGTLLQLLLRHHSEKLSLRQGRSFRHPHAVHASLEISLRQGGNLAQDKGIPHFDGKHPCIRGKPMRPLCPASSE